MSKYLMTVCDVVSLDEMTWKQVQEVLGDIHKPIDMAKIKEYEAKGGYYWRNFSYKFLQDPLVSMMSTVFDRRSTYDPAVIEQFKENLVYVPETNSYVFNKFSLLRSGKIPKPEHFKKFFSGEDDFKLNLYHCDLQLLSTSVELLNADILSPYGPSYTKQMG